MHNDVMKSILDLETEMYRGLNTEPPITDDKIPPFRLMRWMAYSVLSQATLQSWAEDLAQAKASCRNVLTEKYALFGGQIESFHHTPVIEEIVAAESAWMEDLRTRYPRSIKREQESADFARRYAECELESWSDLSLACYLEDVHAAQAAGRNLCEERYNNLNRRLGHGTLAEMEQSAARA